MFRSLCFCDFKKKKDALAVENVRQYGNEDNVCVANVLRMCCECVAKVLQMCGSMGMRITSACVAKVLLRCC